jgi:hypothetical protein
MGEPKVRIQDVTPQGYSKCIVIMKLCIITKTVQQFLNGFMDFFQMAAY